ncbi:MAG: hypothetical protein NT004_06845, partial [Bacteroidetes bacterium]|nr:hypothetical protein [Bacteroidota bacterium]
MKRINQVLCVLTFFALNAFFPVQLISRDAPITSAGSKSSCPGAIVSIPITVTNFTQITAVSLRLDFNPTLMTYSGYDSVNAGIGSFTINEVTVSASVHKILVSWSNFNPLTLANGARLLNLKFSYISGAPTLSFNNTSSGGGDCEYADEIGDPMNDIPTALFYFNSTITGATLPVSVTIAASANPVCAGTSVTFTATPTNGGTTPAYQWKKGGSDIAGATVSTYTSSTLSNGDAITCLLTSNETCASGNPATSNTVTMTVNPNLPVSVSIAIGAPSNHSVTNGQTTTIDVLSGNLSYAGLAPSSGNKVYMFSNGNLMSRDVNRAFTYTATALYYSALVNVLDAAQIPAGTPDYFMHFGATSGSPNTIFGGRLGIKSVNSAANYRLSILNTSGGTPTFTEFGQDLSFGTTYLVVVKYDRGVAPTVAYLWVNPVSLGGGEPSGFVSNASGTATFPQFASICLRNSLTTPKVEIDEIRVGTTWAEVTPTGSRMPNITLNPALLPGSTNTICAGTSVAFTATPTNGGTTPAYQWKKNGIDISGATGTSYTSSTLTDGDAITCTLTSNATCATGNPATSNTVTMIVNPNLPVSVAIAASANPVCAGTSATFTATPTNGGTTPAYQWKKGGTNISGATGATYTSSTLANGDVITCTLTSNATCATGNPATSNAATMTVNPILPVSVAIAASANPVSSGTSVTFTATTTNGGTTPVYQWKKGGADIEGATNATYSYIPVNADDITCLLNSNALCTSGNPATSNTVTMTVLDPLLIEGWVRNANCKGNGDGAIFTSISGGLPPYSYLWNTGETTSQLWYLMAGSYTITVTDAILTAVSQTWEVSEPAEISCSVLVSPVSCSGAADGAITMQSTAGGTPPYMYHWSTGAYTPSITGLASGTYYLTIQDFNSCDLWKMYDINQGAPILPVSVTIAASANPVCTGTSVTFTATPTNGGTTPVYQWKVNGSNVGTDNAIYSYTPSNGDIVICLLTSNETCTS